MHSREMIELAAFVSTQGPALLTNPQRLTSDNLARYRGASNSRIEHWNRLMAAWDRADVRPETSLVTSLCEEVLTADVLVRVWSTLLAGCHRVGAPTDAHHVALDAFAAQQQMYGAVLEALLDDTLMPAQDALSLDRLRRRAEGWSDLLVGHLTAYCGIDRYAPRPERARQFAADQAEVDRDQPQAWKLVLASLRLAFRPLASRSPSAPYNAEIASAILGAFDAATFEPNGLFPSLWMSRMAATPAPLHAAAEPVPHDLLIPPSNAAAAFLLDGRWESLRG
jgi:hypothetical protein